MLYERNLWTRKTMMLSYVNIKPLTFRGLHGIGRVLPPAACVSVLQGTVIEGGEYFGEQCRKILVQMLTETEG
jgi:hypothetical protein